MTIYFPKYKVENAISFNYKLSHIMPSYYIVLVDFVNVMMVKYQQFDYKWLVKQGDFLCLYTRVLDIS